MPEHNHHHHHKDENNEQNPVTIPMPKHVPFPHYAGNSELFNEMIMFLFTTCAATMQFINIHRTNWWLPFSQLNHIVNLHNIEPYLILLITIMNGRRLLYCLSLRMLELTLPKSYHSLRIGHTIKLIVQNLILALLGSCIAMMYNNQNYLTIFLLIYIFLVYLLIFGLKIEPFLRFNCEIKGAYINGLPFHCCSNNPINIRNEIEMLRNDFNNRLKQVIFTSVFNAYYAGFLPCFFANFAHYNTWWVIQHIVFLWLGVLTMGIAFNFPAKYSDILHRAALHLGYWTKMELRPGADCVISAAAANWNKSTVWPSNTITKYCGDLYRCYGPATVALPGNNVHCRFYKLFCNPSMVYGILTFLQGSIILIGLLLLFNANEWNFILSLSFITLTNQFIFFKFMRDYMLTKWIYYTETSSKETTTKQY